jgi:hypothetical protein
LYALPHCSPHILAVVGYYVIPVSWKWYIRLFLTVKATGCYLYVDVLVALSLIKMIKFLAQSILFFILAPRFTANSCRSAEFYAIMK